MNLTNQCLSGLMCLTACLAAGCASNSTKTDPANYTAQALQATASVKNTHVSPEIIQRFKDYNGDFSSNNIVMHTKEVYAADVWFRDPFKEIHGEPEFEAYLLRGSSAVAQYSMEWSDVAKHDGDYYFRWVMTLRLNRDGKNDPPTLNNGISHVRFGPDGKVIFHEDYFDAATFLYEKVPVLGGGIRFIKKRL
ncbi:MAG TPA: nuclear transport factor 2 family protein [Candidatus Acidoferrales bacterium]|nr:nuclear transport factor 2 family protein [Candidatus Acidoferrales bacterium]